MATITSTLCRTPTINLIWLLLPLIEASTAWLAISSPLPAKASRTLLGRLLPATLTCGWMVLMQQSLIHGSTALELRLEPYLHTDQHVPLEHTVIGPQISLVTHLKSVWRCKAPMLGNGARRPAPPKTMALSSGSARLGISSATPPVRHV